MGNCCGVDSDKDKEIKLNKKSKLLAASKGTDILNQMTKTGNKKPADILKIVVRLQSIFRGVIVRRKLQ